MSPKAHTANENNHPEAQVKTRLLLALWDLGEGKNEVNKSDLTGKVKRTGEKSGDYQSLYQLLEKEGAISIAKISLTEMGLDMLGDGLKKSEFEDEASGGARTVKALLKWIRHFDSAVSAPAAQVKSVMPAIGAYEVFKQVVLEIYDRLNRDYNFDNLVPIYRIRREMGERVSRDLFNKWLMEMQAKDIFQLRAGEVPDITPDKRQDSLVIPGGGLRYYAKRLS
jgi:hypothetical protein